MLLCYLSSLNNLLFDYFNQYAVFYLLFNCRQEAKTYPDVVIADLDVQQMNKKQTVKVLAVSRMID